VDHQLQAFSLKDRVAVLDRSANRVLLLTPTADLGLDRSYLAVGRGAVKAEASKDQARLFVLSVGDVPRRDDVSRFLGAGVRRRGAP